MGSGRTDEHRNSLQFIVSNVDIDKMADYGHQIIETCPSIRHRTVDGLGGEEGSIVGSRGGHNNTPTKFN